MLTIIRVNDSDAAMLSLQTSSPALPIDGQHNQGGKFSSELKA
jgi:hypothetical protein